MNYDNLRTCSRCGGEMRVRSSTRGQDWRVQMAVCSQCNHRQLTETKIIRTAHKRFKRGEGFDAEVARRKQGE